MRRPHNQGEAHGNAKLTDDDVRLMRALRSEGLRLRDIAIKFDVSPTTAAMVCRYEAWRHVR